MLHQCTYSSPLSTISIRNCMIPWWQMTEKIPVSSKSCIAPNFDFDAIGWAFLHPRQPLVMNTDEGPDCQWMLCYEYRWRPWLSVDVVEWKMFLQMTFVPLSHAESPSRYWKTYQPAFRGGSSWCWSVVSHPQSGGAFLRVKCSHHPWQ